MSWADILYNNQMNLRTGQSNYKHGQIYEVGGKQQVWDSQKGAFQDVGNAGDLGQVLANWTNESATAKRYFDWNSDYNKTLRDFYAKQAEDAAPSQDDFLSDQAATGMSSSGLAGKRYEAARMRTNEQASNAFTGAYLQGQGLGVQAQLSHEQQRIQMAVAQNELELKKSAQKNGLLNSIIGSVIDVGVTAATGGFNKVAQAGSEMLMGDSPFAGEPGRASDYSGSYMDSTRNIGENWGRTARELSFADQFRKEQLKLWGG